MPLVPEWVKNAVFYQIFPDRFANGDPDNDPPNVQPWGSEPTRWGFQGGDLRGVIDAIPDLLDLGVGAIYLNPIFLSPSNHRYNTTDYYSVDPKLGSLRDFHELIASAHAAGIRVILDGVFNHCGRGFFAFSDLLENQEKSPYRDWFHVLRFPVRAYTEGAAETYRTWWDVRSLPKFNTANPQVRSYLLDVARYWLRQGADGWRLDVPNEIDDDSFWREFRAVVKAENSQAYLLGEIWDLNPRWVGPGHFDGLMNYPFRDAALGYLVQGSLTATEFARELGEIISAYPREHLLAHYLPLGSHDTERLRTACREDARRVRQAFVLQFVFPGIPGVYYGDEIGLAGGADPECRGAFPPDRSLWDHDLRNFVRSLIRLRKEHVALREGEYRTLFANDARGTYIALRHMGADALFLVLNASDDQRTIQVPVETAGWERGDRVHNYFDGESIALEGTDLQVVLEPRGAALYLRAE